MPSIDNVTDLAPRVQYTASPAQTDFDYPFPIFEDNGLVVYVDDTLQVLTTDYTVDGEGEDLGGTVTFTAPLTGGEVVTIFRDTVIDRTTDFQQNGPWTSVSENDQLDKLTIICQELAEKIQRCIRFPFIASAADDSIELSPISDWFSKTIGIDANGNLTPIAAAQSVGTASPANPTGTVGLVAVNGSSTDYMRADGAPALSQAIVPTWSGRHTFSVTPDLSAGFRDGGVDFKVGYRNIPQNAQTGNYPTVLADGGKHIHHASGAGAGDTYTIAKNATVAYELGTAITFTNLDSNAVSIAIDTDTLIWADDGSTGTRTLAQYGVATALKVEATVWLISGTGLS